MRYEVAEETSNYLNVITFIIVLMGCGNSPGPYHFTVLGHRVTYGIRYRSSGEIT